MLWHVLAAGVVLAHAAFVAFAAAGGFLTWRYPRAALVHLPALAWAAWIELSGRICPLTPLENAWRLRAGELGYSGGFIEHYLLPILYPIGLTRILQWELAGALLAINALAYGGLVLRSRRGRHAEVPGRQAG